MNGTTAITESRLTICDCYFVIISFFFLLLSISCPLYDFYFFLLFGEGLDRTRGFYLLIT